MFYLAVLPMVDVDISTDADAFWELHPIHENRIRGDMSRHQGNWHDSRCFSVLRRQGSMPDPVPKTPGPASMFLREKLQLDVALPPTFARQRDATPVVVVNWLVRVDDVTSVPASVSSKALSTTRCRVSAHFLDHPSLALSSSRLTVPCSSVFA